MSAPRSPSGETPGRGRRATRLWQFVLLLLIIRLVGAALTPLTEDEAYYRQWAQTPALGYYDHPPMIAWWIWLGRALLGDSPVGIRLVSCLSASMASLLVFDLTRRVGATRESSLRAVVWYNATLLVAAGAMLAVPDAPAALFWLATLCCVERAKSARHGAWWIGAGVTAGLAALSKYSALFLGPGVFLWLMSSVGGRRSLRSPGPWLTLITALAIFGLNVGWNAAHHWMTFAKQFGRIAPHRFTPMNVVNLIVVQAVLLNPLIAIFLFRSLTSARQATWSRSSLLILSSLPFAAYLVIHACHDRVQAHWPAPIYAGLAATAALAAEDHLSRVWTRLREVTPVLGFGLCALAAGVLALPQVGVPLPLDPGKQIRDWPGFSVALDTLRMTRHADWIGVTSYGLAAELLAQPEIHAPVLQIAERDRWRGLKPSGANLSRRGMIVDLQRRIDLERLSRCFQHVQVVGELRRAAPGETGLNYLIVQVEGPRRDIVRDGC